MKKCRMILASGSPRRKEILSLAGIEFEVRKSEVEEITTKDIPAEIVCELSMQKALETAPKVLSEDRKEEYLLILGADTIVSLGKEAGAEILGKPVDEKAACAMIQSFQGKVHYVYTGVTVLVYQKKENGFEKVDTICFAEETEVQVCEMTEEEIKNYVSKGESLDKAGAYGIQGSFAPYIRGIRGDYYNVVGLPLSRLYQEIKKYMMLGEKT